MALIRPITALRVLTVSITVLLAALLFLARGSTRLNLNQPR